MSRPTRQGRGGRVESTVFPREGVVVLELVGELDIASVPRMTEQLQQLPLSRLQHVVFDLQGVSFLAASGIRMLVTTVVGSGRDPRQVHLVGLASNEQLRRVLDLVEVPPDLLRHVTVRDVLDELGQEAVSDSRLNVVTAQAPDRSAVGLIGPGETSSVVTERGGSRDGAGPGRTVHGRGP